MQMITSDVFRYILGHGFSISGEHGDGLARVKHVFQKNVSEVYSLYVKTKQIFDKNNIMNPGKKVLFDT
jgi:FAD/FMN-containing dehydrogenase